MGLAMRHGYSTIQLSHITGMTVHEETSSDAMARLQERATDVIERRFAEGHTAWIASIDGRPAAWGWVATRTADIGEMGLSFGIPPRERYLWNFVTLPAWRGRGIYPRLLDAIVRAEAAHADRFWIAYAPENRASEAGIRRAGFEPVAELSFDEWGRPAVHGQGVAGTAAAALLGLSTRSEPLAPCWRCLRAGRTAVPSCRQGRCACDYQVAASGCALTSHGAST